MDCRKCGSPWNHLEQLDGADKEQLVSVCDDCGTMWEAQ